MGTIFNRSVGTHYWKVNTNIFPDIFQPTMLDGQFIKKSKNAAKSVSIIFLLNEAVGALSESLKLFKVTNYLFVHCQVWFIFE